MDINEDQEKNLSNTDIMFLDEYDIFKSMDVEIDRQYSNEIPKKTIKIIEDLEDITPDEN